MKGLFVLFCGLLVGGLSLGAHSANVELKFGGWSNHLIKSDTEAVIRKFIDSEFSFNENHKGLGLKVSIPMKYDGWEFFAEYWHMKESHNHDYNAYAIGLSRKYSVDWPLFDSISWNLPIGIVNRSEVMWTTYDAWYERSEFIHFMPHVTLYSGKFGVDLALLPNNSDAGFSLTSFVRLGYRF